MTGMTQVETYSPLLAHSCTHLQPILTWVNKS